MKIGSKISQSDSGYRENFEHNSALLEMLNSELCAVTNPEQDRSIERHIKRGKLFVRERIAQLLDPSSPFLEIGALTGLDIYEGVRAGAGIVCGIGLINSRQCMIIANDATVKGGTYFPLTVKKHLRAQEIAEENNLPCVYLVDSGGAFLPMQDQVFPDRDHFGRIFYNQARMSAKKIAQIAVVMGSCTAGGAYVPAMSDISIIVRNQGTIFLGGPPLVKAATGEEVSAEDLGGADVHCKVSGVTDYLARDDYQALELARQAVASLNLAQRMPLDWREPIEPVFSPEEILGLVPCKPKQSLPMYEIIARIVDASEFDEFKQHYGTTLICGFARIEGYLVGIIANNGILFSESALKAVHFIQLCNQRRIPLLFFQDIVGFMVGKEYERGGIAKDGAKMVNAVACSTVPKFTVVMGGSFGAGNYGMAGRAYQPRLLTMWPNARISVMGPEQAAGVLTQVKQDSLKAQNKKWSEKEQNSYRQNIEAKYNSQATPYYSTARLWDDAIIDPTQTRKVIALSISASLNSIWPETSYGVFRT